jgi:integrase
LYLDLKQRRALVDHLDDEAAPFVRALCLLPLRPGAVAKLTVGDFDKRTRELTIGRDKNGKPRRVRIPMDCATLFAEQSKDKDAAVPLFTRSNGKAWDKETWKLPIAAAVKSANLPAGATAYTLRHSTITDLVNGRLPLLTIAQISGTSVQMIEKHYGHLDQDVAEMALVGLSL